MNTEVKNVIDLFVEDRFRQAKRGNLAEHESAAFILLVVKVYLVSERREVASNGQRGGSGADQRDLFAVGLERRLRHEMFDLVLVVSGDSLQAADGDGFFVDAPPSASGFARSIA